MCWPIIVTPESRSMQKASKSGREKVGLAMSRSFFRCVVSALPSSKDLDSFYAFNTPRSQNRSTPKIPKSHYNPSARAQLLAMSAATIDRYLKAERDRLRLKGISTTKPGTLLRNSITVRKAGDELEAETRV